MAVIETTLERESHDRYLTYALSVVSGRALPDVRDGLKPVQRRILYAMYSNLNLKPTSAHRKSAAVVGEVLARFHPHGDQACYEAMVRMAQEFSLRYPLVDGQGNFGSLDGDEAAAYRYTEAKLTALALEVIGEIDEETVDFRDNFDSTTQEPAVLPSRIPNLLINGASGIAVGMATSIPPHNLKEVIKGLIAVLEEPEIIPSKLTSIIRGPDFPTGCQILNSRSELNDLYKTGRGAIRMRGEWEIEDQKRGKKVILITSIPYTVNKSQLVEKIADLILQKKIPQLNDIRDESTDVVRVVLELSSGADPELAMAYLFKNTQLETNFPVNLTALVPAGAGLRPELLSLKEFLVHFLDFRKIVVKKRLEYEKKHLLARIHILEALVKIYDALDEAIKIVRKSDGRSDAASKLRTRFKLTEIQSFAVVDMRIYQLSKTDIEAVRKELDEKEGRVKEIEAILKSSAKIAGLVKKELEELGEKFGDKRLSKLVTDNVEIEFNEADYIVQEEVFAIVTADSWIKRIRQSNELNSTRLREGDSIKQALALSTLDSVAFFTNFGSLFSLKVSEFPSSSGYGDPVQKILKFKDGERIVAAFGVKSKPDEKLAPGEMRDGDQMLLVSKRGLGFGLKIEGLDALKRNGKRAMKVREGDALAAVCHLKNNIAMFTRGASGLVIPKKDVAIRDSAAVGVSLMGVRKDDELVSAISFNSEIKFKLNLDGGKEKQISSSEVVAGHRALKGNKVVARGELISVEIALDGKE